MPIKLIVGLKNPGANYEATRHNVGGWFVEAFAQQHRTFFKTDSKLHGDLATIELDGMACKLLLPSTFMNHSGIAVRAVAQFYRIQPAEILVAHDDLDLDVGRIKLKTGGGHGGHNGLRDIMSHLGTPAFHRLRIGIGHPGDKELVLNFVLGKPSQQDRVFIHEAIDRATHVMPKLFSDQLAIAMSILNTGLDKKRNNDGN